MSLQISGTGTREGILKQIEAVTGSEKLPSGTDKAQADAVKAAVLSEIAALDKESNAVRIHVEASATPNVRIVQIQVWPLKIHI